MSNTTVDTIMRLTEVGGEVTKDDVVGLLQRFKYVHEHAEEFAHTFESDTQRRYHELAIVIAPFIQKCVNVWQTLQPEQWQNAEGMTSKMLQDGEEYMFTNISQFCMAPYSFKGSESEECYEVIQEFLKTYKVLEGL